MSKQASEFQERIMSRFFRGKEIFKPLNTGLIDERVSCVREYIANIFFYTKNGVTIMIDAGYNYDRLKEKMGWLDLDSAKIRPRSGISSLPTRIRIMWERRKRTAMGCSGMPRCISASRRINTLPVKEGGE